MVRGVEFPIDIAHAFALALEFTRNRQGEHALQRVARPVQKPRMVPRQGQAEHVEMLTGRIGTFDLAEEHAWVAGALRHERARTQVLQQSGPVEIARITAGAEDLR